MIDAVVIGCGAGGSAMAWRLAKAGAKVLILEAGPAFDPDKDYKLDQPDWETHQFPEKPGSKFPYVVAPCPFVPLLNKI